MKTGKDMQCTLPNMTNRTVVESGFFMQALQMRGCLAPAHLSRTRYIHPRFLNTTYSSVLNPTIASTASG